MTIRRRRDMKERGKTKKQRKVLGQGAAGRVADVVCRADRATNPSLVQGTDRLGTPGLGRSIV
jgi:hypothetical protein